MLFRSAMPARPRFTAQAAGPRLAGELELLVSGLAPLPGAWPMAWGLVVAAGWVSASSQPRRRPSTTTSPRALAVAAAYYFIQFIENNFLVTSTKPLDLMEHIPIEAEAIESLMAEHKS